MNIREILKKHAYTCCLNWLLLVGILKILNQYYELNVKDIFIITLPLIWVILFQCFDRYKKNIVPYIMIVLTVIILSAIVKVTKYPISTEAKKYFKWLGKLLKQGSEDRFSYSLITICIFLFIISIPCYLLLKKYSLRILIAVIIFIVLIIVVVTKQEVPKVSVSFFLTFILMSIMDNRLSKFYRAFHIKSINVMTFLLPFALIMTVAILILPANKEPIQWKFIKDCWANITNAIEDIGINFDLWLHPEKTEFSLNFSGYSENGDVGGSLEFNDAMALKLELNTTQNSNIYLIGNIKNEFDGKEWSLQGKEATYLDELDEYLFDIYELAYALQREGVTSETYFDYYRSQYVNIEYEDITTKALFYPLKISMVQNLDSADSFTDKTANFRFDDAMGQGTRYKVGFAQLNLGSEYFNQLISNQANFTYQKTSIFPTREFNQYLKSINIMKGAKVPEDLESLLLERSDYIRDHYTDVYDSLPSRVYELVKEITKAYTSDYDKLIAIQDYLSTYTYTTNPSQPGKEQDLIDYMLFQSKEGYCTYYATAFAVMARCIGIPTRYVQGFCVENVNQQNRYNIYASYRDAHAWAEAYIEGIGWLPFEPTPSYADKLYNPWVSSTTVTGATVIPTSPVITGTVDDVDLEGQVEELQKKERKLVYQSVLYILISIFILTLFASPLYLLIKQSLRNSSYKKASISKKAYLDVCFLLSVFYYCDREIEQGETFSSYMNYIRARYGNQEKNLTYLEQIYLRIRYNDEEIQLEEQQKVEKIRKEMMKEVRDLIKRSKYIRMRIHLLQAKGIN